MLSKIDLSFSSLLLLACSLAACSLPPSRVNILTPADGGRPTQTGIASWYGPGFHGKPTASGTIYDQNDLTAAHQTLPLGTRVMVTALNSGRTTEVIINDRGPFAKGRIIDLSYAAAESLGMTGPGTIPVRVEVLDSGRHPIRTIRESLDYTLQLGSFSRFENAQEMRDQLLKIRPDVVIVPVRIKEITYYRVQLGTFSSRSAAEHQASLLAPEGFPVIIMEK
jgi:rare lipoprotein A